MSQKKSKDIPEPPSQEKLPSPRLIWQGTFRHLADLHRPCRVVLTWRWRRSRDDADWETEAVYVFEKAETTDALGEWRHNNAPLTELPGAFFEAVLFAFDSLTKENSNDHPD